MPCGHRFITNFKKKTIKILKKIDEAVTTPQPLLTISLWRQRILFVQLAAANRSHRQVTLLGDCSRASSCILSYYLDSNGQLTLVTVFIVGPQPSLLPILRYCSVNFRSISCVPFFFFFLFKRQLSGLGWSWLSYQRLVLSNWTKLYFLSVAPLNST